MLDFTPDVTTVVRVPTYYGARKLMNPEVPLTSKYQGGVDEFDKPKIPIAIHEAEGLKLVLGTNDTQSLEHPTVQIERRPNGWAIFLQPLPDGDLCGTVYFHDDGRSWFVHEWLLCTSDEQKLQVVENTPEEIDELTNET